MFALLEDAPCAPFLPNIDHFQRYFWGSFEKYIESIRSISNTVLCASITSHFCCQPIRNTDEKIVKIIVTIRIFINRSTSFVLRHWRLESLLVDIHIAANSPDAPKCPMTLFDTAAASSSHATTIKKRKYTRTVHNARSWPCSMPHRRHLSQGTHYIHVQWSCAYTRTESPSPACTQRACRHNPFSCEIALRGYAPYQILHAQNCYVFATSCAHYTGHIIMFDDASACTRMSTHSHCSARYLPAPREPSSLAF